MTLLATGLPSDDYQTHVCVLTHDGPYREPLEEAGIPIHSIDKKGKVDPAAYFRLKRLIKRVAPDLVHTWIFAANSYGRYAALRSGVKKIIAGERCVDPWKRWHQLTIDRYLAKRTTGIVTNSSGVRDFYVSRGIDPAKFEIIPNGIETPTANFARAELRKQLLDSLNLPHDTKLMGAAGRLWPQKRFRDLIWAADLLKCIRDDTHLLIMGSGPEHDQLHDFRDHVEIADRVHFLGERSDAREIISCLDVYWIASDYEGQSNAVMEAMAAGIPVVASDIPGNRDLVVDQETGIIVPVGDRAAIAQKTETLLNEPERAREMGQAGQERIRIEFSLEKMLSRYEQYYARILHE